MKPVIDHIHMTVTDLDRAERFYDRLLPMLGFDLRHKAKDAVPGHEYEIVEYNHVSFSIGIVSPRKEYAMETVGRRKPGALHHLAFRVESSGEVDHLFERVATIPADIVHEPRLYPEYSADYYAFFFKDPEGIELEIVSLARERCFQ